MYNVLTFKVVDGRMQMEQRRQGLDKFCNGSIGVLLASLRSVSLGLNLFDASQVILVDPWWYD